MECRKLTKEELIFIYETYAALHFPKEELKPVKAIERLWEERKYMAYGLYEKEELVAYACFVQLPESKTLLLDYYAVLELYRGGGAGGEFLKLLQTKLTDCTGIYIESEEPGSAVNEEEKNIRERRIGFYQRNGAEAAGMFSVLFGVAYRILYLPCAGKLPEPKEHYANLEQIYKGMFSEKHYETCVELGYLK